MTMTTRINAVYHADMRAATGHEVRQAAAAVLDAAWRGGFKLLETLASWQERSEQRRKLASFDARMLRDIGISRAEAAREYDKPFWRV